MFERLRQSLRDAMSRASSPEEGRAVLAMMRDALVQARMGVAEVRDALRESRTHLAHEQKELATVRRRRELAAGINDSETVEVADRFEKRHLERIAVLERKISAQESELALAESELDEMNAQYRAMQATGGTTVNPPPSVGEELGAESDTLRSDTLRREMDRAAREAEAERQLSELKRKMGR
ncbi:MAG TPA: hypothetical protein VIR34_15075 [Gemmatimonadaceae bacterium]|jgi:hypothetical protein